MGEMMKTMSRCAAQGDLMLRAVDSMPDGVEELKPEGNRHVVAHSETGHYHWLDSRRARVFRATAMLSYLHVLKEHVDLIHARENDRHETIRVPRGLYEIRRQREYTPEGWRRVED